MNILGIDTSCDDTSAAVVSRGEQILSSVVSSQTDIHNKYGGIVPELASRRHVEMIWPVVDEALSAADISFDAVNAIAVCCGPGLIGSLLVGCGFAKAVGYARNIPLVGVNHLEGHIFSAFLEKEKPEFPFLSLIASGGHTSLFIINGFGQYKELGRTRDDAAGEAYDKVSKLLGLGYPGGPLIDKLALDGDAGAFDFPRAWLPESFDFSFSGLKTAVKLVVGKDAGLLKGPAFLADLAASFQASVVDVLVRKVELAIIKTGIRTMVLSGGVASNSGLRKKITEMAYEREARVFLPSPALCTDNAAMIASAGYYHFIAGETASLDLNPKAYLKL
jgi:N6-L-threonylcarbamoyladenine synthase